jgi:hypothetical protein
MFSRNAVSGMLCITRSGTFVCCIALATPLLNLTAGRSVPYSARMRQHQYTQAKMLPLVSPYFGWSVAESYRIEDRPLCGREVRVVVPQTGAWTRVCRPGQEDRLVEDLAAVADEKSLLAFSVRYGLLGFDRLHREEMRQRKEHWAGDPVLWALSHARFVSAILSVTEIINDVRSGRVTLNDDTAPKIAEALAAEFRKAGVKGPLKEAAPEEHLFEYALPGDQGIRRVWVGDWERDPFGGAYTLLTELINPNIRGVHYEFIPRGQNAETELGTRLRWNGLLEVVYWQLAERVGGEFRLCPRCARVFPASGRRKYCSTQCMNIVRCRNYRVRKNQRKRAKRRKG